jgi:hypothetical protein
MESRPHVYQLRIRLIDVSPIIWRRILVTENNSLFDLHHTIQIAMGWEDVSLNQFKIHEKIISVYNSVGMTSGGASSANGFLRDFQFTDNERFSYEYNFFDNWQFEIRVEKILPINPKLIYPCCIDGKRVAPPEDCGGPTAFMELQDYYSEWRIMEKLALLVKHHSGLQKKVDDDYDEDEEDDYDDEDEEGDLDNPELTLETIKYWVNRHKLYRDDINSKLRDFFNRKKPCGETSPEVTYED